MGCDQPWEGAGHKTGSHGQHRKDGGYMYSQKKKIAVWGLFLVTSFLVFSPLHAAAETKIGYVISQKILMDSEAGKDFIAKLEKLKEQKEQQMKDELEILKHLEEEAKSKQMFLNFDAKEELEGEIREKEKRIERLKEDSVEEFKKMRKNNLRRINEEASKIIMDIGEKEEYDLIIDINSRASSVVYANPEGDITDQVIELYNQQYKTGKK